MNSTSFKSIARAIIILIFCFLGLSATDVNVKTAFLTAALVTSANFISGLGE